jgi:hypothetical protein
LLYLFHRFECFPHQIDFVHCQNDKRDVVCRKFQRNVTILTWPRICTDPHKKWSMHIIWSTLIQWSSDYRTNISIVCSQDQEIRDSFGTNTYEQEKIRVSSRKLSASSRNDHL